MIAVRHLIRAINGAVNRLTKNKNGLPGPGDLVTSSGKYPGIDQYFRNGPLRVVSIMDCDLGYTGGAIVTVHVDECLGYRNIDVSMYADAVKKVQ